MPLSHLTVSRCPTITTPLEGDCDPSIEGFGFGRKPREAAEAAHVPRAPCPHGAGAPKRAEGEASSGSAGDVDRQRERAGRQRCRLRRVPGVRGRERVGARAALTTRIWTLPGLCPVAVTVDADAL